jgi:hypothetical protein
MFCRKKTIQTSAEDYDTHSDGPFAELYDVDLHDFLSNLRRVDGSLPVHPLYGPPVNLFAPKDSRKYWMRASRYSWHRAPLREPSCSPHHEGAGPPSTLWGGVLSKAAERLGAARQGWRWVPQRGQGMDEWMDE